MMRLLVVLGNPFTASSRVNLSKASLSAVSGFDCGYDRNALVAVRETRNMIVVRMTMLMLFIGFTWSGWFGVCGYLLNATV